MSREIVCPSCGAYVALDPRGPTLADGSVVEHVQRTTEILIPATLSAVDIDLGAMGCLVAPPRDPQLGPIVVGDGTPDVTTPPAAAADRGEADVLNGDPLETLPDLGTGSSQEVLVYDEPPGSPSAVVRVDLPADSAGLVPDLDLAASPVTASPAPAATPQVEEEAYEEVRGSSWPMVLLGSYASAMTLACIYLLWIAPRRGAMPETLPSDSRSGVVLTPIADDHLTTLGKPSRIGSLEWTPLGVKVGPAGLESQAPSGVREKSEGRPGSLVLRVRFRNLSPSEAFAPLDRAFVRHPDRGAPESLIEVEGDGTIDVYPLAMQSEQAILGQSFEPLKPGEERETLIVSEAGASDRAAGAMTWRLRLRTDPDQTEVVGVKFHKADLQK